METHITPRRTYFLVYLSLLLLLAVTVAVSFVDLGFLNPVIAMTIAIIKATLVILFFMHVRGSSQLTKLFLFSGFFWLMILVGLTLTDYLTRPK